MMEQLREWVVVHVKVSWGANEQECHVYILMFVGPHHLHTH
jgi:hypothetical protein